ncbi:hypothetical protein LT493_20300 [Streptomyces tricolor]|nr:hypothetical protein [Streptomyces tricolor]
MYDLIDKKRSVRKLYTESLIGRGDITLEEAEQALQGLPGPAGEGLHRGPRGYVPAGRRGRPGAPGRLPGRGPAPRSPRRSSKRIAESQVNIPDHITVHPRLQPQLQRRAAMVEDGTIDWGMGRDPGHRLPAAGGHPRSGSRARTPSAAPSASATR